MNIYSPARRAPWCLARLLYVLFLCMCLFGFLYLKKNALSGIIVKEVLCLVLFDIFCFVYTGFGLIFEGFPDLLLL